MNPTPPTPERVCETCGGSGAIDTISKEDGRDSYRKCSSCHGTGQEPTPTVKQVVMETPEQKLCDCVGCTGYCGCTFVGHFHYPTEDVTPLHDKIDIVSTPNGPNPFYSTQQYIDDLIAQAKAEGYREGQRDGAIEEAHEMARWYVKNSGFGNELTGPGEHAQFRIRQARVRYDQLHKGENNGNLYCY